MKQRKQALDGLKVVDFGWVGVGPFHAQWLGNYGATVIRVESHSRPDVLRRSRPFKDNIPHLDRAGVFPSANSSKYGITLDISKPKGRELAFELIKWCDVMVVGLTKKVLQKLEMDYNTVRKVKSEIIYFCTSQMGFLGRHSHYRGYGGEAMAIAGLHSLFGWPTRSPAVPYIMYPDMCSPFIGVGTILAALDYRRRTGKGQFLDQSQIECALIGLAPYLLDYKINRRVVQRHGNRSPYAAPHGVYRCKGEDRWCAITVFKDEQWVGFSKVIGEPEWVKSPKFSTFKKRKENEDELDKLVENWTINYTAAEAVTLMQVAGVPAGIVRNIRDVFESPQLNDQGAIVWLDHPVIGRYAYVPPPFKLSKTPAAPFPSPCIGQHNEYVYKEILGLSDDEIGDLLVEGVITTDADLEKEITASW
jgi:crotonobetainyl-CoA:carnitine CoA-transferase CaiB-like acyl-CoA transferase